MDIFHDNKYLGVMTDEKLKWSNQAKFFKRPVYTMQFVEEH